LSEVFPVNFKFIRCSTST